MCADEGGDVAEALRRPAARGRAPGATRTPTKSGDPPAPTRAPISAIRRTTATSGPVESLISAAGAAKVAAAIDEEFRSDRTERSSSSQKQAITALSRLELEQRQARVDRDEGADAGDEQRQPPPQRPDQADAEDDVERRPA